MSSALEMHLHSLTKFFEKGVEEVRANRPGRLWIVKNDGTKVERDAAALDAEYWAQLLRMVRNRAGLLLPPEKDPRVGTLLPGGHRLQLNMRNHVHGSNLAATIRLKHERAFGLADYELSDARFVQPGEFDASGGDGSAISDDPAERLRQAVERRENVLVAGGTGSGKTALLNALLTLVDERDRVLTVEDVPEVDTGRFVDCVRFTPILGDSEERVEYRQLMDDVVRHSPDRLLVGECRIDNTWLVLRALNVGHSGFLGTIHANNTRMALEAVLTNVRLAPEAQGLPRADVEAVIHQNLDLVVHIEKRANGRRGVAGLLDLKKERLAS